MFSVLCRVFNGNLLMLSKVIVNINGNGRLAKANLKHEIIFLVLVISLPNCVYLCMEHLRVPLFMAASASVGLCKPVVVGDIHKLQKIFECGIFPGLFIGNY